MQKILVTGGAGFIGSNFIHHLIENTDYYIINYDKLTYAADLSNLGDIPRKHADRYLFIEGDICDSNKLKDLFENYKIDYIVNFAAETHVDRSIKDSSEFLQSNFIGTGMLLNYALEYWKEDLQSHRYIQISTDEVYGAIEENEIDREFFEDTPLSPHNPYSASKASADMLVQSYWHTYNFPAIITRCSNNFGPRQYPEKLIPVVIQKALANEPIPLYGDGKNIRDWIFVDNHSSAISTILNEGKNGEVFNIGTKNRLFNIDLIKLILDYMGKPHALIKFVEDRLGHDRIYRMNIEKILKETSWKADNRFVEQLKQTIDWYIDQKNV